MHMLLIRHAQSYVNLDDWDQGFIDTGLTPLGEQQAEHLAKWMSEHITLTTLYTSTMARTLETAARVEAACRLVAQRDDRLREFGNCYADGSAIPPEAMPIQYAEFWGTERPYTPIQPGRESWLLFRARVGSFVDDLLAAYGRDAQTTVAVICHGGVVDAVFDYVFNVGPHRRVEIWSHNTGIVHWEYLPEPGREPWRLHAHGMVHHLMTAEGNWLGSRAMLRDASRKSVSVSSDKTSTAD